MIRAVKGRYQGDGPAAAAPEAKSALNANPANKRRALGDITNAAHAIDENEKSKKASAIPVVFSRADQEVDAMADDMSASNLADRAYMQRPSDDIDSRDSGNPLMVASYVNEMYDHFSRLERQYSINPNYMTSQSYINDRMRCILIDWLVEVHLKFKMVPETLYMTVSIIDRYLQLKQVRRSKLQLVGVASLLIAAKYEEIYPPEFRDLVFITDRAYDKQEIIEMEIDVALTLSYDFTVPTAHTFLCRYLKAAHADRAMVQLACFIAERTLQEISMLKFLPSTVAAAAVYVARKSLRRHPWSPSLLKYTKYDEEDLAPCVQEMQTIFNNASQQQAVTRKYSGSKFGSVAKTAMIF